METLALPASKTDGFLRMGMSKNPGRFREWQQGYNRSLFMTEFCLALFLTHSNTQVDT